MNLLIWNTRGVSSANFRKHCEALVNPYNPTLIVLVETKMVDHKLLTTMLYFDAYLESNAVGKKGGIVIMWKGNFFNLQKFSISS